MNRTIRSLLLGLPATALLTLLTLGIAGASPLPQSGLVISPGRIQADQPLTAGQTYTLPTHSVNNNGGTTLRVSAALSDYQSGQRALPPGDWFQIEPAEVVVPPNESRRVQVTVALPEDAAAGQYEVWCSCAGAPESAEGITTGAGVQVPVVFDDQPKQSGNPWGWTAGAILAGMAVVLAAGYVRQRRRG